MNMMDLFSRIKARSTFTLHNRVLNLFDPITHVLLGLPLLAFPFSPGIALAWLLWVREAAQKSPNNIFKGLDCRNWGPQKHLEVWPPALVFEMIWWLVVS